MEGRLLGTVSAMAIVSLLPLFVFRSVRLGLISLIPNFVPAAMALGPWGYADFLFLPSLLMALDGTRETSQEISERLRRSIE